MWVHSVMLAYRVGLILNGNKLYVSLQQQDNSIMEYLHSPVPSILDLCENIPHKCFFFPFFREKM